MDPVLSFTKGGAIYVPSCNHSQLLFPLNAPPSSWSSCSDAGEYTWSITQDDLSAISIVDKTKLARSMGFCPHNRCQLGNLTNARNDGHCPANLCYTKLENGGRSFGACCFIDNEFNSGALIGYYDKTQHAPKPIYKKSRIILGDSIGGTDESYNSFINANQIHPHIIATQCPLSNTVGDVLQMLVEQNISLWIQLAPFEDPSNPHHTSQCTMSPAAFAQASMALNTSHVSIQNLQQIPNLEFGLQQATFSVDKFTAQFHSARTRNNGKHTSTAEMSQNVEDSVNGDSGVHGGSFDTIITREDSAVRTQDVTSIWYNNWKDFTIPAAEDEQVCFDIDHFPTCLLRIPYCMFFLNIVFL